MSERWKFWLLSLVLLAVAACADSREPPGENGGEVAEIPEAPDDLAPSYLVSPRLTQAQYARAVADVLDEAIVVPARLEPDSRNNGFVAVGAVASAISPRGIEQYEDAAYEIAGQVMQDQDMRERVVGCEPADASSFDESCARPFFERVGLGLWRRPLSTDELDRTVGLARTSTETLQDFWQGMEFGLAALLQSPHFLYRFEPAADGARELDDFEMATRLAFVLWNTTPDQELLEAAAAGELTEEETLSEHVWRMLEDPRARAGIRSFFTDLYELDRLDDLNKAPELFPHISEVVGPSAREETLRVIERIVFEERGDFRDIMTTRRTYLNPKLASIYNVKAPLREGFGEHEYDADHPRVGLLGQTSFLALWAHPVSTSATLRGMFVQTKLLCRVVPPPPSGVDTSIPVPSGETPTLRDRIQEHLENPACAGCHNITDPIGLSFEHFDGIGRYRKTDNGAEIDASGKVDGEEFETMAELATLVRDHERFGPCLSEKFYTYATGHEVEDADEANVEYLAAVFSASGYDLLTMIHALVTSPAFRSATPVAGGQE